jgi:hypothetical protein
MYWTSESAFNTQLQNAGVNTNVSDQTRNFGLKTTCGLNNGVGASGTITSFILGVARGGVGSFLRGLQNVVIVAGARSAYALNQTLSIPQYFRDVRQADSDFNSQVAACHQAYGN